MYPNNRPPPLMKRPLLLHTRLDGLHSTQFSRLPGHLDLLPRGPRPRGNAPGPLGITEKV